MLYSFFIFFSLFSQIRIDIIGRRRIIVDLFNMLFDLIIKKIKKLYSIFVDVFGITDKSKTPK